MNISILKGQTINDIVIGTKSIIFLTEVGLVKIISYAAVKLEIEGDVRSLIRGKIILANNKLQPEDSVFSIFTIATTTNIITLNWVIASYSIDTDYKTFVIVDKCTVIVSR